MIIHDYINRLVCHVSYTIHSTGEELLFKRVFKFDVCKINIIVYNVTMQAVSNDSRIVLPLGSQAIGCEDQVSQSGGNDVIVLLYGGLISRWGIFKIH